MKPRLDVVEAVLSSHGQWFPHLNCEEIMALTNLPTDHLLDTRFGRELLAEGEARGEALGRSAQAAAVALRQLSLVCGSLSEANTALIQALPLAQLEALTEALLRFRGSADLAACLERHGC